MHPLHFRHQIALGSRTRIFYLFKMNFQSIYEPTASGLKGGCLCQRPVLPAPRSACGISARKSRPRCLNAAERDLDESNPTFSMQRYQETVQSKERADWAAAVRYGRRKCSALRGACCFECSPSVTLSSHVLFEHSSGNTPMRHPVSPCSHVCRSQHQAVTPYAELALHGRWPFTGSPYN